MSVNMYICIYTHTHIYIKIENLQIRFEALSPSGG